MFKVKIDKETDELRTKIHDELVEELWRIQHKLESGLEERYTAAKNEFEAGDYSSAEAHIMSVYYFNNGIVSACDELVRFSSGSYERLKQEGFEKFNALTDLLEEKKEQK